MHVDICHYILLMKAKIFMVLHVIVHNLPMRNKLGNILYILLLHFITLNVKQIKKCIYAWLIMTCEPFQPAGFFKVVEPEDENCKLWEKREIHQSKK